MMFYLLSIVFYIYGFLNGLGEESKKGKIITWAYVIVSAINLWMIYTNHISYSILINFLLSVVHIAALLLGLLFALTSKKKNNEKDGRSDINHESKFNANIVDDGRYSNPVENNPVYKQDVDNNNAFDYEQGLISDNTPINYNNLRIDGHMFDVHGTYSNYKITIYNNGTACEFYVQNGQIVAYRTDGMKNPKSY